MSVMPARHYFNAPHMFAQNQAATRYDMVPICSVKSRVIPLLAGTQIRAINKSDRVLYAAYAYTYRIELRFGRVRESSDTCAFPSKSGSWPEMRARLEPQPPEVCWFSQALSGAKLHDTVAVSFAAQVCSNG